MAKKCKFPITEDEAIFTQLTANTICEAAREKLMIRNEADTFDQDLTVAVRAESNVKEAAALGQRASVNAVITAEEPIGNRRYTVWPNAEIAGQNYFAAVFESYVLLESREVGVKHF